MKINQGLVLSSAELNTTQKVCKICMEAKHLRTKFNTAKIKAKRPLQIIYTDLCGLISSNSSNSKKCNNEREYVNKNIYDSCKERKDIELNTTISHTSQNADGKVRALLFDADMDKEMWRKALYTATCLLNRFLTETFKVTSYKMRKARKPNLNNLQVFS
ncbi:Copia protein [Trachymyrmex cornetzi]|uniref:Copia protein n=1 Tax=Trachymyrmex cornetzi TaxID=471704 RepID=A0A195EM34_9HYME|nr:Copia protein [Trachymyrmex cornetzi]